MIMFSFFLIWKIQLCIYIYMHIHLLMNVNSSYLREKGSTSPKKWKNVRYLSLLHYLWNVLPFSHWVLLAKHPWLKTLVDEAHFPTPLVNTTAVYSSHLCLFPCGLKLTKVSWWAILISVWQMGQGHDLIDCVDVYESLLWIPVHISNCGSVALHTPHKWI